jgi:hypothetical protein
VTRKGVPSLRGKAVNSKGITGKNVEGRKEGEAKASEDGLSRNVGEVCGGRERGKGGRRKEEGEEKVERREGKEVFILYLTLCYVTFNYFILSQIIILSLNYFRLSYFVVEINNLK